MNATEGKLRDSDTNCAGMKRYIILPGMHVMLPV